MKSIAITTFEEPITDQKSILETILDWFVVANK